MSDPKNEDKSDDKGEDRYTVPALARGLQLLMSFNRDERELTGAELSRRLDLPRASVFRMLQTLVALWSVWATAPATSWACRCCAWVLSTWPRWS